MLGLEAQDNYRVDQGNDDLSLPGLETFIPTSGRRLGLYAQDEWRLGETLSATLGLRLDHNDVTGLQSSPRLGLLWQATPATTLKALYGRAHRAPNAYERDFDDGGLSQIANPGLGGERIDALELVADTRVHRDLSLRASVYHWRMDDIAALVNVGGVVTQYQAGERIQASGAELSGIRAWDGGTRLRASLAYQDVAYAGGGGPENSPRWLGKLNFSSPLPWAGLSLGYELQYDAARRALDGTHLEGYWLSNLQLTAARWARGLEVSLGVYNLFNQSYAHPGSDTNYQNALDQDGRSLRLRVDYRF